MAQVMADLLPLCLLDPLSASERCPSAPHRFFSRKRKPEQGIAIFRLKPFLSFSVVLVANTSV